MTVTPCAWVLAEHAGLGGAVGVPQIHEYAGGYIVRWAALRLSVSGSWDDEPLPSSRSDRWIARHTFASLEAAEAALRSAPDHWRPSVEDAAVRAGVYAERMARKERPL